jgi:ADP-ribose pyrophosphatase
MHIYLAKDLHKNPLPADEGEVISIAKISFEQALEFAESGRIEDAKSLAALFLARQYVA